MYSNKSIYYPNGNIKDYKTFHNGLLSTHSIYFENKVLKKQIRYFDNGNEESFYLGNKDNEKIEFLVYNEDKVIIHHSTHNFQKSWYHNEQIQGCKKYLKNTLRKRSNGYSNFDFQKSLYCLDGRKFSEEKFENNELNSIIYYKNGEVQSRITFKDKWVDFSSFYNNGIKSFQINYFTQKFHPFRRKPLIIIREQGGFRTEPIFEGSQIFYNEKGQIMNKYHFENGSLDKHKFDEKFILKLKIKLMNVVSKYSQRTFWNDDYLAPYALSGNRIIFSVLIGDSYRSVPNLE